MKSQSEISSAMSIRHELINFYVITTGFQNSQFHIGQARWSQIVHTITSPPLPFASPQLSIFATNRTNSSKICKLFLQTLQLISSDSSARRPDSNPSSYFTEFKPSTLLCIENSAIKFEPSNLFHRIRQLCG